MKYALELHMFGKHGDPHTVGRLAGLAERSGWDGVFLEDYVYFEDEQGHAFETFDPWVELAVIAMRTEHVRIGTELTPLSRRRPWKVARETVTLDHLSNGRLTLTVGLGGFVDEMNDKGFTHFGEATDAKTRARMLDEGLDILAGLWSGRPFSYGGDHYKIREITFLPVPVQRPRIPVWIGGFYPRTGPMRRAARWDGYCPEGLEKVNRDGSRDVLSVSDVIEMRRFIDEHRPRESVPRRPYDLVLGGGQRKTDERGELELRRQFTSAQPTWWMEYVPQSYMGLEKAKSIIQKGPVRVD